MTDQQTLYFALGLLTMCFVNWLGRMGRKMAEEEKKYWEKK